MNRGLLAKSFRETWVGTLLVGLGVSLVEGFLAYLPPKFFREFSEQWLAMPFLRKIVTALVGLEVGESIGPQTVAALAWMHPLILALLWAHAILFCTRMPAAEIDRGTIDVFLALPVSRLRLYLCESVAWFLSGVGIIMAVVLANILGGWFLPVELRYPLEDKLILASNLFCLYFASGGIAWAVSAACDRRGRAIGLVFGVLAASFLLNALAPFHPLVKRWSFLSILNYHRPLPVLQGASWPLGDMLVLIAVGLILWLAGWLIFRRRDICTV